MVACDTFLGYDNADVDTIVGILSLLGIIFAVWGLRHSRSANFVSAWIPLRELLQKPYVTSGRTLLRKFYTDKPATRAEWPSLFKKMKDTYGNAPWYQRIEKAADGDDQKLNAELERRMRSAYHALEQYSILAIHSHIPGFRQVFMTEWNDSIINGWEQSEIFVTERLKEGRTELPYSFATIYVEAKRHRKHTLGNYPSRGPIFRILTYMPLRCRARKARREIDAIRLRSGLRPDTS